MGYQFYPFKCTQVTVTGTATQLVAANASRSGFQVINTGTNDCYLGESNVTTSTGHLLAGTKGTSIGFATTQAVYAITGGASQVVTVLETF
jgi:hypothetical protein